jgi:ankyrin repeat protein
MENGASADVIASDGTTPLQNSLWLHGNLDLARALARDTRFNINAETSEGLTAVYYAAKHGALDLLRDLHDSGASLSAGSQHPIFPAIQRGLQSIAKFIANHAEADTLASTDETNSTPLLLACQQGDTGLVKILAKECPITLNARNDAFDVPVTVAAVEGHFGCLKLLLQSGVHCSVHDAKKRTPLHLVMYRQANYMMAGALTRAAPVALTASDHHGLKPIHLMVLKRGKQYEQLAKMLLCFSDASLQLDDAIHPTGMTVLMQAVVAGNKHVVDYILRCSANPDARLSKCGSTALLLACRLNGEDALHIAESLILAGADTDAVDSVGCCSLYYAVLNFNVGLLQKLIDGGCNVDQKIKGYSVLAFLLLTSHGDKQNRQKMIDKVLLAGAHTHLTLPNKTTLFDAVRTVETKVVGAEPVWMDSSRRYEARFEQVVANSSYTTQLQQVKDTAGQRNRDRDKLNELKRQWRARPSLREEYNTHTKDFDIFISYRVQLEGSQGTRLAQFLAMSLALQPRSQRSAPSEHLRVWIDQQQLKGGVDWEQGFLEGLRNSATFMPLISDALMDQFKSLTKGATDNVMREWDEAIDKHDALGEEEGEGDHQHCPQFLPLAVGRTSRTVDGIEVSVPFNHASHPTSSFPEVVLSHNENTAHRRTVRETIRRMQQLQWTYVDAQGEPTATARIVAEQFYKSDFSGNAARIIKYLASHDEDTHQQEVDIEASAQRVLDMSNVTPPETPTWDALITDYISTADTNVKNEILRLKREADEKSKAKLEEEHQKALQMEALRSEREALRSENSNLVRRNSELGRQNSVSSSYSGYE